MDYSTRDKDPGRWEVDEDPASHPDETGNIGMGDSGNTTGSERQNLEGNAGYTSFGGFDAASDTNRDATLGPATGGPGSDTGAGENPYGSTTGETANRHSAGPSGLGQSSGLGPDVVRDATRVGGANARPTTNADFGAGSGRPSGSDRHLTTSDPAMADEPVEGGEPEVDA